MGHKKQIVIVWFRQDLRITDNPALHKAVADGADIIPVYILDDVSPGNHKIGAASRVWLHHALEDLDKSLSGHLYIGRGDAKDIIPALASELNADSVYWNRCYEPWSIARDKDIKATLKNKDIACETFNASLLWEPWTVTKSDGTPYKVFTPFYKKGCLGAQEPRTPAPAPKNMSFAGKISGSKSITSLDLLPVTPRWDKPMMKHWDVSEKGAKDRLDEFLDHGLRDYSEGRDYPARKDSVSRLSPYLHFGMISPHQVWHAARLQGEANHAGKNLDTFLKELAWREFSYNLLYHFPTLPEKNFQPRFDKFKWLTDNKGLMAWKRGKTGYPIVDAAMRQMWQTGYMHNRARMIVGSFLCKHLMVYWTEGEAWFWDCLFDADLANNAASWQWIAGSGADAAPYFRIYNPIMQGEKFDADGDYVREFVPELAKMPAKYIHRPWEAPPDVLARAGVVLGKTYPKPIVEHGAARERALAAFKRTA